MVIECQKICPLLNKICEQNSCGWWNENGKDCSMNIIANSLDIQKEIIENPHTCSKKQTISK